METRRLAWIWHVCTFMLIALYDTGVLRITRLLFSKPYMATLRWGFRPRHPLAQGDQGPKPIHTSALFDAVCHQYYGPQPSSPWAIRFGWVLPGPMRRHVDIRCDAQTHGSPGYPTAPASTYWAALFPLFAMHFVLLAPGGPCARETRLGIEHTQ